MLTSSAPEASVDFTRRDAWRLLAASVLLIAAMSAILGLDVLPAQPALVLGQPAPTIVQAPRASHYISQVLTNQAKDAAREAVEPQYTYTAASAAAVAAQQARAFEQQAAVVDAAFAPSVTPLGRQALLAGALGDLSSADRKTLTNLTAERWQAVRAEAARVLATVEGAELRDSELPLIRSGIADRIAGDLSPDERSLAAAMVGPLLVPNSSYSEALTQEQQAAAAAAVAPVQASWEQGETIVANGVRIDAAAYEAIVFFGLNQGGLDVARLVGFFGLSILTIALLLLWTWRFRREFWHRNNVLLLLSVILLVAVLSLKLTAGRYWLPYALPLGAVGMLVTVLLDGGPALVLTALLAILAAAVNGGGYGGGLELAAYTMLGGIAGIVAVRRGDRLSVFVRSGVSVFVVQAAVIVIFALLGRQDMRGVLELIGAVAVSSGGAAVATAGSVAVVGSVFGILTVFQLLELANPSAPLLRRLLVETPGTYHHSLMVGNLAERAAEAIGADPLVARVAAYYHDVGKLSNPAAFIENQAGGDNLHDELDPEASAQLLKSHVSEGIDIAYGAGLPKQLIAFIPQHHGTGVMSYFYARAKEAAAAPFGGLETAEGRKAADAVDIRRFRHGGPKPQSREAAIIMLADSVEASVRSLASRDEGAIRAMVARIFEERIADGQFNECDLTLRDLERIREAFVGQLLGMYHQRVAYPQNKVVELESRRAKTGDE
ncbi:MAG: HD family phosphohydrolase [Candidatus Limnocylindrales bacterium]